MAVAIPGYLLDPKKKEELIVWISELPIDPEDRKRILVEWAKFVGVAITEDDVKKALAKE